MTLRMMPVTDSADAELVHASLAGDREAFGQIVSRYQSLVCSLAYSATGSLSQSEDIAQETFLTAWKRLSSLREPVKLRAWLCGVASNLISSSLRSQGREPSHRAESLEEIPESHSPEPLPVDRAISQEEAQILWRSLERIPETYRTPLVLFYREHHSVEAVAQKLDLTEETVRQRLSRGRKMLQEEVLGFVEVALERTAPGRTFTLGVVAALPLAITSAEAAATGAALAKVGAGAKSALSWAALGSLLAMVGAIVFSWKTAVDESTSPRERRLMVRMGWFQVVFFVLSLGAALYVLPRFTQQPLALGIGLALLLLANVINGVLMTDFLSHRRTQIQMEEGVLLDPESATFGPEGQHNALRKAIKFSLPFLLLFLVGSFGLPWKEHPARCAIVVGAETLILLWAIRRYYRTLTFQIQPPATPSKLRKFLTHPLVLFPLIMLGAGLLGGMLPIFLRPNAAGSAIPQIPWLRSLSLSLLVGLPVYGVFALFFIWKRKQTTLSPQAAVDKACARFLKQRHLTPDQASRLKELVVKKTTEQVRSSMALMNRKLTAPQRAEIGAQLKAQADRFNAQIREALGEETCLAYLAYEKSVPDQTAIDQFQAKSARTPRALTQERVEQLIEAITQARAKFPWTTDLSRRDLSAGGYTAAFAMEHIETFAEEEELFERQFLPTVERILRPDQLAAFGAFLKRQRQTQITGYKMVARLFGPRS